MPHKTFFGFILPSLVAMLLFIALPIASVAYQSVFVEHKQVMNAVETCDPFGCKTAMRIDVNAMTELRDSQPQGRFNGLGTYLNATHLATHEIAELWRTAPDMSAVLSGLMNLPFYKAMAFTLAFTFIVTPASILFGFAIALAVNALPRALRGTVIYFTLLPMIVPTLLSALVLFWMIDQRGIIGSGLQWLFSDPELSLKASPALTWIILFLHGTWNAAPFVFIILYAGLQTVPRDTLEAAMIDGASRFMRLRLVVLPHLRPLMTFLVVVSIMDNFRVFETIVGFSAGAYASSLSTLVFNDLRSGDSPLFGSAAATSMLTILCIGVLLVPSMIRSSQTFRQKV
ncbi:carbohydrate ABC transporter permease [Cypionkella sp. TWP1-2-1b2]|uniref:carbohydrate ABC transporter permease n=1 Tax=Cypionkella sp. TWP1-2-1b2 TaxID=2804675 RepID=UPI003CF56BA0